MLLLSRNLFFQRGDDRAAKSLQIRPGGGEIMAGGLAVDELLFSYAQCVVPNKSILMHGHCLHVYKADRPVSQLCQGWTS